MLKASNAVVGALVGKLGLNLGGAEALEVKGRTSGNVHAVPVNPVEVDGQRYLFSPRGETAWVQNIRVSHAGVLRRGRSVESFNVEEVPDAEKAQIIRAYLDRWYWQVGNLLNVPKDADEAALAAIAPNHPVFRIIPAA